MEKSLIRKMLILISGILISSLLFFIVISATYDSFYRQTVIKDKSQIASAWASSIDNRLNSMALPRPGRTIDDDLIRRPDR